MALNR